MAGPPQAQPIGRWRSTQVSPAGLSAIFDFHTDNRVDSYSAAISEEKYRLIGTDTILFQSGGGEEKQEVEWDSQDRARIENEAAGKSIELTRLGSILDSTHPLTGEWTCRREWKGTVYPARALFSQDGHLVWIAILRAEHGSFSVQGNRVRLEVPGHPVVNGDYAVTKDLLTLPSPNGGEMTFKRF